VEVQNTSKNLAQAKAKKSWREKLAAYKHLPQIKPIPEKMRKRHGEGTILIPHPLEVDAAIKCLQEHQLATITQISNSLAQGHGTTIGCTVTTGIFAWIVAHAAHEAELDGEVKFAPYWRLIKAGGELNPKYPGGIENLIPRLEAEGHTVVQKGRRFFVENYEQKLIKVNEVFKSLKPMQATQNGA